MNKSKNIKYKSKKIDIIIYKIKIKYYHINQDNLIRRYNMKIEVISDIHSNIYALNEVLADIKNK